MDERDQQEISIMIGACAFAALRGIEKDPFDVNTFPNDPDFTPIGYPSKFHPRYYRKFLLAYFRHHTFYEHNAMTPPMDGKLALNCGRSYEAIDNATPTTIIRQLLIEEWGRCSKEGCVWKGRTCEQNESESTRFALFADRLVFLNVGRRGVSLVASINTLTNILWVKKITADDPTGGHTIQRAIDPSTKV